MEPYYNYSGIKIYCGNALEVLKSMEAESVQCAITSPPYFGLRDYQVEPQIWDGDKSCEHTWSGCDPRRQRHPDDVKNSDSKQATNKGANCELIKTQFCQKCGAWKGSLGNEPTMALYIDHLVQIFSEVKRVLRKDGVLFLNLGDSYMGSDGAHKEHHANSGLSKSFERGGVPHATVYGTSGKALAGYQDRGCLCENLCDVCRKAYRIGKFHSNFQRAPTPMPLSSVTNREHMEFESAHLPTSDSLNQEARNEDAIPVALRIRGREDEPLLDAQVSTPASSVLSSTTQHLQHNFSTCLLCGRSLNDDGLKSSRKSGEFSRKPNYNQDNALLCGLPNNHSQNKDKVCEYCNDAYQYPTTEYHKSQPLKPKDLIGIPWQVAFALQADGWYLRQDIIWHKPNPMPESVKDRCTKSHEYIFLLTKSGKYYYNADAIKEPAVTNEDRPDGIVNDRIYNYDSKQKILRSQRNSFKRNNSSRPDQLVPKHKLNSHRSNRKEDTWDTNYRNKRSVWSINTKIFKVAHFATFPSELPRTCILAGSKADDIILDPLGGTMTTLMVAQQLNRKAIGIEMSEDYIKMGINRLAQNYLPFG